MPIQYLGATRPPSNNVEFFDVPPERTLIFLSPPTENVQVYLHWGTRGSIPCLGNECQDCDYEPFLYGYAAVAQNCYLGDDKWRWQLGILGIPMGSLRLATEDLRGYFYKLKRSGKGKHTALIAERGQKLKGESPLPFSVRDRLEALWRRRMRKLPLRHPALSGRIDVPTEGDEG